MFHAAIKFSGTLGYPAHRHPKERRSAESTIAIGDFGMSRAREWRFIFEAIAQIRGVMAIRHAALLELAPDDETAYRARRPCEISPVCPGDCLEPPARSTPL